MHAVARLVLHPLIPNIQTSWVKMGPAGAAICLDAGANDLGGTLMNESISRAAGTQHGQEFPPDAMEALIRSIGREPQQRDTLYRPVPEERRAASFVAADLAPIVLTPPRKRRRGLGEPSFGEQFRQAGFLEEGARARAGRLRQAQEGGEIGRMVDIHGDAGLRGSPSARCRSAVPRRDAGSSCSRRSAAARRRAASR